MPYGIRRKKDKWEVYKKDTGEHVGYSKSKRNASSANFLPTGIDFNQPSDTINNLKSFRITRL